MAPGEVACPRCGAGNSPERHFCRRCALELGRTGHAVPAEPPPPPPRRRPSPVLWAVLALVLLVLLLVFVL
ncbi:hypothetical protein ACH9EU_09535 [Kocuria sp. M1R5S2]|uniref:hypothetical protein n=1 Tax=Kocuria rhizosphaerae TaxID=3376285 RepID=UPI0037A4CFE3